MKPAITLLTIGLVLIGSNAQAGSLVNGQWQAANCGQKPPSPTFDTKSVDSYNQSVKDINACKQRRKTTTTVW